MIDVTKFPQARIFETHGVEFTGERNGQLYGYCPFSDKEDKFYVNSKTWLWDSKTAGMAGNIQKFLDEIHKDYRQQFDIDQAKALAKDRGLPRDAFRGIGWTGNRYTFAVRDPKGKITDIRLYNLDRHQMRSTAGCSVGLLGAHQLESNTSAPVYLCEGEWDAIALQYLLRVLKQPGIVLAVPGAGTFKREWVSWLRGRHVHVLYDHDEAGRKGEQMVADRIRSTVQGLTFVHWPDTLPEGFDVRDWVRYGLKKNTPDLCWERLQKLFKRTARVSSSPIRTAGGQKIRLVAPAEKTVVRPNKVPTLRDVHRVYKKWLHLPNTDTIDVMLATALSQQVDGPPIWLFLVGPPGGAKTVTLSGLSDYPKVYSTSSLTAHSLISGANFQGATDPSLIPKLDDKILCIKDFTSILGMKDGDKEEIFSILRDAYDGRCGKVFGNGVERSYESRFTIIAAVTPSIYELASRHNALGERFLKWSMGHNLVHAHEEEIISRAIENVDSDSQMREEISAVTGQFLTFGFESLEPAELDNTIHRKIIALAQLGARIRGTVPRDAYHNDVMTGRPFAEIGSRLGVQLAKIARSLAMVRSKTEVTDAEYRIVKKIMIDTVSQKSEDMIRKMHFLLKKLPPDAPGLTSGEIEKATRYSRMTVGRMLQDLHLLRVVNRQGMPGKGYKHYWTLSPYVMRSIEKSEVYSDLRPDQIRVRPRLSKSAPARP